MNCQGAYLTTENLAQCDVKSINVSNVAIILMSIFVTACCCSCLTSLLYCLMRSITKSHHRTSPVHIGPMEHAEAQWVNDSSPAYSHCVGVGRENNEGTATADCIIVRGNTRSTKTSTDNQITPVGSAVHLTRHQQNRYSRHSSRSILYTEMNEGSLYDGDDHQVALTPVPTTTATALTPTQDGMMAASPVPDHAFGSRSYMDMRFENSDG